MAQSHHAHNDAPQRQRSESLKSGVADTCVLPEASISQVTLPKCSARGEHKSALPIGISSTPPIRSSQLTSVISDGSRCCECSPVTLGCARGIRRPRLSSPLQANNNLTLAQLNFAEALAALKARSDASTKSTGSSAHGPESCCEILPLRMSGPVTLKSLPSVSSTLQDGSASKSYHIVTFNGQTIAVPEKIFCHLCDFPMKFGLRKTKYKGGIRLYASYRCLRKGCQTFRSVRSVIKADESYEDGSQNADVPTGTLIYVKKEVTLAQMEKMLEFDFKFFNNKPAPKHMIPRLLFGHLNMSISELEEHLETTQGQKEIQQLIMRFHQPSPPPCIIEAVERWDAVTRSEQSKVHSTTGL